VIESGKLLDAWMPPEGAGKPLACLATTFTFEPGFFESQCLGRFLGLDWKRGEGDELAFLIEQEERLAEARASVLVDRSFGAEGRSLRWDILPIPVRRGVFHPKITLLVWDKVVRFLVASANLTPAGYRQQVEIAMALDARNASQISRVVFEDLIEELQIIVERAVGNANTEGPKLRALQTLHQARERVAALDLPQRVPGRLKLDVIGAGPGRSALEQIDRVWSGGPARRALVLSPYFDTSENENAATKSLLKRLAARGPIGTTFVVRTDSSGTRTLVRAPASILASLPDRARVDFRPFEQPDEKDIRPLHAKAILIENETWTAAMVGSSNFTTAGLGLMARSGNLEVNVAIGAPRESRAAQALRDLFQMGATLDLNDVDWQPQVDEEELSRPQLPWGFADCLVEPGPPPELLLKLVKDDLPAQWEIKDGWGAVISNHAAWDAEAKPPEMRVMWGRDQLPLLLHVSWTTQEGVFQATWPVNVTTPGSLPSPEELRGLPAAALLIALSSTRPMHETLSRELQRMANLRERGLEEQIDPLKRYSGSGLLLHRARRMAEALQGLKRRLETPAANLDALAWRLNEAPFGPLGLARALHDMEQEDSIEGEVDFLLAELALTLKRVDLAQTTRFIPQDLRRAKQMFRKVLEQLNGLRSSETGDPHLASYIEQAFVEAGR
jgi:hypothetical protein